MHIITLKVDFYESFQIQISKCARHCKGGFWPAADFLVTLVSLSSEFPQNKWKFTSMDYGKNTDNPILAAASSLAKSLVRTV